MGIKLWIFLAVFSMVAGYIGYQEWTITDLKADIVILESNVGTLEKAVASRDILISNEKQRVFEHIKLANQQKADNKVLQDQSQEDQRMLNRYKGRQHIVFKKPGLVQKMEQRAMDKFFEDTLQ